MSEQRDPDLRSPEAARSSVEPPEAARSSVEPPEAARSSAEPPEAAQSSAEPPEAAQSNAEPPEAAQSNAERPAAERRSKPRSGPGIDGVSGFFGMRWEDPQTAKLTVRDDLINGAGLLSGVVAYALVDYTMGSALWVHTAEHEMIATINIAINYLQTATAGEVVCRSVLDRRNRTTAMLRSEVHAEDGRLLVTAVGSYAIFVPHAARPAQR